MYILVFLDVMPMR